MFNKIITRSLMLSLPFIANWATASETFSYQQGSMGYTGAVSTQFGAARAQNATSETHIFRYNGTRRYYNLEYFALDDIGNKGQVESAKLIFYRTGGYVYTTSDIYARQILDPDDLGRDYPTGWKVGSGFRAGANLESRDDSLNVDAKWRSSDPHGPDDLNKDYFQGVLKTLEQSPFFTPQPGDAIGTAYELDVTADVLCIQEKRCPNHGWALFHDNDNANIQHLTASSNYPDSRYRPKLIVTYGAGPDNMEPLVIESFPYNESVTSINHKITLSLLTNEKANCKYDLSPLTSFEKMNFSMHSADGTSHSSLWPVTELATRSHLYGRCQDHAGNISRTPHVYTFTVTENLDNGGATKLPYQPDDLLPGISPEEVLKTLYTSTNTDLKITLGDLFTTKGGIYSYQVQGHASCQNSVSFNICTFNNDTPSTELLTVNYTGAGLSGSHKIIVVTQAANTAATTNYITNNKDIIMPDYGETPPIKGESRVDPVTGATIKRLTDASEIDDSDDALIVYSRYSPENSNGDYLLVFGSNSTSSRVIDRKTGKTVAKLTGENGKTIGENHEVRWDNSGRHPNRVYYVSGMTFWMIDDITDQANSRVMLKDFAPLFPNSTKIYNDAEGDSSNDSDHWAWMAVHYGEHATGNNTYLVDAFIHYQVSTDTVHAMAPGDLAESNQAGGGLTIEADKAKHTGTPTFSYRPNMIEMSPSGTGIVIHMGRKWDDAAYGGAGADYIGSWFDGPHLWPVDFNYHNQAPVKISVSETHSGWAFNMLEQEVFISQNNRTDKLDAITIAGEKAGYDHRIEVASHGDLGWQQGFHFGKMPRSKPGWLFYNSYSRDNSLWAANQFMMIQIKPETQQPAIWRISPSYNHYDGNYRDEAPAAINMSGNRIYWSSNWGGALDHREVFMIELPDNWDKTLNSRTAQLIH
ncbi:hypothetical protein SG34_032595 [Thalassomonas viridans]|uniref:Uncharacterized protein n=1 Tax=Thalassomonas viridans TaxID=137584 RepID=A0AAE9Z8V3_9GAMM|nr:hypothetical protein [Thalassomonas viridans]WDE08658.1 hypothetical protein SG34_032595 [Thalassomonas viridans]